MEKCARRVAGGLNAVLPVLGSVFGGQVEAAAGPRAKVLKYGILLLPVEVKPGFRASIRRLNRMF
jgi:hypothetical protein